MYEQCRQKHAHRLLGIHASQFMPRGQLHVELKVRLRWRRRPSTAAAAMAAAAAATVAAAAASRGMLRKLCDIPDRDPGESEAGRAGRAQLWVEPAVEAVSHVAEQVLSEASEHPVQATRQRLQQRKRQVLCGTTRNMPDTH